MRKIKFNKAFETAGVTGYNPAPSTKAIPEWYRKMTKYSNGKKETDGQGQINLTVKSCPPFLDSMMSGYTIFTEYDIYITQKEDAPFFEWREGGQLISTHMKEQVTSEQIPDGYGDQPLKFNNLWQIRTPKGYSTAFMHPVNRVDLPFFTISGIVETDTYKNIINFPFFLKENFEGLLPAGTPIVQLFPFKREVWNMEIGEADAKELENARLKLNHKLMGGYKSQWWQRKEFK